MNKIQSCPITLKQRMVGKLVPVWKDALSEAEYEGIAELISEVSFGYNYAGKYFRNWKVKFIGKHETVIRVIDDKYIQIFLKRSKIDKRRIN